MHPAGWVWPSSCPRQTDSDYRRGKYKICGAITFMMVFGHLLIYEEDSKTRFMDVSGPGGTPGDKLVISDPVITSFYHVKLHAQQVITVTNWWSRGDWLTSGDSHQ